MADNRLGEAIEIVARKLLATEWTHAPNDIYVDDLELSGEDIRAVIDRARHIVLDLLPEAESYRAALDFLQGRAGDNE